MRILEANEIGSVMGRGSGGEGPIQQRFPVRVIKVRFKHTQLPQHLSELGHKPTEH